MAQNKRLKVLACLSGGVDSSVTAALLVRAGYDVTAAFMINYDNDGDPNCWRQDYRDAVRVAAHLNIPIIRLDFSHEYKTKVLDGVYREYSAGRTPNPDILCNEYIKFGAWLDKAKALGFDCIATGHYATIKHDTKTKQYLLQKSADSNKDQTYFLHRLNQEQLAHTLFPIGGHTKPQVRTLAKKFKLPTAERAESMGICFIGEVPMREFLDKKITAKPGKILSLTGEVLGEHEGLGFYTIGQRHNLGLSGGQQSLFVLKKDLKKNTITVGEATAAELNKSVITLENVHWINGQTPRFPVRLQVRSRHQQKLQSARLTQTKAGEYELQFSAPQRGLTPGQSTVFYHLNSCLGGGIIS